MALGALSSITALAVFVMGNMTGDVAEQKLRADVATINAALRVFEANGGTIGVNWDEEDVLAELKTVASTVSDKKLAGIGGASIDPRVAIVMETPEEADDGNAKALWDVS